MILFEKIRYKNFLSSGNTFIEMNLMDSPTTLIVGKNGTGKSMLLDALTFSLFGKTFRNINIPQLVNCINEKQCVVEIEFSIGKKKYMVRRGIKPRLFEIYIDGKLLNQDSKSKDYQKVLENNILKLNYKSFTQVVILGSSSFVPFMQLRAADRRTIIEELLDIQIFSSMNVLLKEKYSVLKDEQKDNEYDLKHLNEKLAIHVTQLEKLKVNYEKILEDNNEKIEEHKAKIVLLQDEINVNKDTIISYVGKIKDQTSVNSQIKKLKIFDAQIQTKIKNIKTEIDFFNDNKECPKCGQGLGDDFKHDMIEDKTSSLNKLESGLKDLYAKLDTLKVRMQEIDNCLSEITKYEKQNDQLMNKIISYQTYIKKIQDDISSNTHSTESIQQEEHIIDTINFDIRQFGKKKDELTELKIYYDIANTLLKDSGIKADIIKQYLPIMNKLINMYLANMDFFVSFELDENFNETIKSRHRDAFTYNSFSEGQKARIDIALLLTWRRIARMKNSVSTNLLIMDEVFDGSLDSVGAEELIKLLTIDNDSVDASNIFIISHKREGMADKFNRILKVNMKKGFSVIEVQK